MDLLAKVLKIKVVFTDVDGVLTDGRLFYGPNGVEGKNFHARDGVAVGMLRRSGLQVGFLTGRFDAANRHRAEDLKVDFVCDGAFRKGEALLERCRELGVQPNECLMMGDDLVDLPAMRVAGVSVAVADAMADVRGEADYVTAAAGGHGAFREMAEWLLRMQGKWDVATRRWFAPNPDAPADATAEPPIISG